MDWQNLISSRKFDIFHFTDFQRKFFLANSQCLKYSYSHWHNSPFLPWHFFYPLTQLSFSSVTFFLFLLLFFIFRFSFFVFIFFIFIFSAEGFFILSCMVQACASLVETAQSLDGFIASFVLGKYNLCDILYSYSVYFMHFFRTF